MKAVVFILLLIFIHTAEGCSKTPNETITSSSSLNGSVAVSNNNGSVEFAPSTANSIPTILPSRNLHPFGTIDIINSSNFNTNEIEHWVSSSKSMMKDQDSNTLIVIYPVGEFKQQDSPSNSPFPQHQVAMSPEEITILIDSINEWFSSDACMARNFDLARTELTTYSEYFEGGTAVQTQVALCQRTRVVIMGLSNSIPLKHYQIPFLHQLYHSYQHDIGDPSCNARSEKTPGISSDWMVEGGAHYFATYLANQLNHSSKFTNLILESASTAAKTEGTDIYRGSIHLKGAAGLYLMVKQNWLDQATILDGTLFQNCLRETEFSSRTPEVSYIQKAWHLIKESDGEFTFLPEAMVPN